MPECRITAVATYLPERVVTNQELITSYGLPCSADWLQRTTGVVERPIAGAAETTLSMAAAVLRQLIEAGRLRDPFVDVLIMTSDDGGRGDVGGADLAACMAGLSPALTLDLGSAQGGFSAALDAATRHLYRGARRVILVASHVRSWGQRPGPPGDDPHHGATGGEGAAGVLLDRGEGHRAGVHARGAELPRPRAAAPCL